jgi:hypothetical protein
VTTDWRSRLGIGQRVYETLPANQPVGLVHSLARLLRAFSLRTADIQPRVQGAYGISTFSVNTPTANPVRVLGQRAGRVSVVIVAPSGQIRVGPFSQALVTRGWLITPPGGGGVPQQTVFSYVDFPGIIGGEWWGQSSALAPIVGWEVYRLH